MNLTLLSAPLLSAIIFFSSISAQANTLEQIQKKKEIIVAVDGATPPFNYYKGKELVGFEIDLVQLLLKSLDAKIKWEVKPFNTLMVSLDKGQFDFVGTSHMITDERKKVVDFADPYYCAEAVIVSRKGGPKTIAALEGKTVAVAQGTIYYNKLIEYKNIGSVKTLPGEADGLLHLLQGKADAWVSESFVAQDAIEKNSKENLQIGDAILSNPNAMIVQKGNKSLQDFLSKALKKAQKNGSFKKLSVQYFGKDISCK